MSVSSKGLCFHSLVKTLADLINEVEVFWRRGIYLLIGGPQKTGGDLSVSPRFFTKELNDGIGKNADLKSSGEMIG